MDNHAICWAVFGLVSHFAPPPLRHTIQCPHYGESGDDGEGGPKEHGERGREREAEAWELHGVRVR